VFVGMRLQILQAPFQLYDGLFEIERLNVHYQA
jgi:hypothetical protein